MSKTEEKVPIPQTREDALAMERVMIEAGAKALKDGWPEANIEIYQDVCGHWGWRVEGVEYPQFRFGQFTDLPGDEQP